MRSAGSVTDCVALWHYLAGKRDIAFCSEAPMQCEREREKQRALHLYRVFHPCLHRLRRPIEGTNFWRLKEPIKQPHRASRCAFLDCDDFPGGPRGGGVCPRYEAPSSRTSVEARLKLQPLLGTSTQTDPTSSGKRETTSKWPQSSRTQSQSRSNPELHDTRRVHPHFQFCVPWLRLLTYPPSFRPIFRLTSPSPPPP